MALYSGVNLFFINLTTRIVPRFCIPPVAVVAAFVFYLVLGNQRRATRANLRVVTGRRHVEGLVYSCFYKYALNWTDVMLMMRLHGKRLFSLVGREQGAGILDAVLADGKGAILVSPHFGNWELGGLGLADRGYRLNVLTFREPDEKVNELREEVRQRRGIGIIYVDRNDTSPLAIIEAVNALRRNEVLALLGDRDGSSQSMYIEFFGRQTAIPVGAAYLSIASGAPVLPVFVPLEGSRYATIMEPPIYFSGSHGYHKEGIREGMDRLLRVFEKYIRRYPDQWYNFFDYWKEDAKPDTAT